MLGFLNERWRLFNIVEEAAQVRTSLRKKGEVSMAARPVTEGMPCPHKSSLRGTSVKFLR